MRTDLEKRASKDRSKSGMDISEIAARQPVKPALSDQWPLADLYVQSSRTPHEPDELHQTTRYILSHAISALDISPVGKALLREAMQYGWQVGLADLGGIDFHLDVPERVIMLDNHGMNAQALRRSPYFCHEILIGLARALRDIWQEKRHGGFDEQYGPEDIMMLERVRAADCDVIAVLIAWQLRSEGRDDLWRHMIGSQEGDMALAFSESLERAPASQFNGKALAACFRQWFMDKSRVSLCDHETLEYMDDLLRCYDGQSAFGREKATPLALETLSCLPDRTAYLAGDGREILRDPHYAGLDDPINQSHFLQILRDSQVVLVQDVPFRDAALAARIFPGGAFTPDFETTEDV